MKAQVADFHTDVFLSVGEVEEYCKPGQGADTCSWLVMASEGWRCFCLHKSALPSVLRRRKDGTMVAMRDGCDKVNNLQVLGIEERNFEF